jgi:hypothetical protein
VTALRAELRRKGVVVAPALLVGLFKMNAPSQAALVPHTLLAELGKMAIVGKPAAAAAATTTPFAWHSVSAWCDVAAKSWGYPAEIVKQMVAVAATGGVALIVGILVAQAYAWLVHTNDPAPAPATAAVMREAARPQPATRPQRPASQPAAQPEEGDAWALAR